jgi:hypothetical protein
MRDTSASSLAEKIIESSQDLSNLGVSLLGSNDDATLLAEVRWQEAWITLDSNPTFLFCRSPLVGA